MPFSGLCFLVTFAGLFLETAPKRSANVGKKTPLKALPDGHRIILFLHQLMANCNLLWAINL